MVNSAIFIIQLFFTIVIGLYFLNLLKSQQGNKLAIDKEAKKEMEKLKKLREIKLTEPLSEKTRPSNFKEIIGQDNGLKALRAALCGPNPQHVIIYGPTGVGKTAAARIVLEEAKAAVISPFKKEARFVEIDATTLRFDERGIADPLIGSVHDPIYQGAGAYGAAGIPQPKPGAVTKAHGGILFIDEIGELHPIQMNKLLKVLEDRTVFFESAYYNSEDANIPIHIHEVFKKGLPADFRLIAATTRSAEELPPAIRSRCIEVYFRPLSPAEISIIVKNAVKKGGFIIEEGVERLVAQYATNGRDAVNIIQIAGSISLIEGRDIIAQKDIEWAIQTGNYSIRIDKKIAPERHVGFVNGLAVYGARLGMVIDIEASTSRAKNGRGNLIVTGIVEQEEVDNKGQKLRRTSCARASIENVLTVIKKYLSLDTRDYDVHINFPGGIPIDGPSAGLAVAVAVYSSITNLPVDSSIAITGEISIRGKIKPVGGVPVKIDTAKMAGVKRVIIPKENWQENFSELPIEIIPVEDIIQAVGIVFEKSDKNEIITSANPNNLLTAKGIQQLTGQPAEYPLPHS